jgi:carbamoyltransferase
MKVLGINLGHNGSICLLDDGEIVEYLEEERISKIKRDGGVSKSVDLYLSNHTGIEYAVIAQAFIRHTPTSHLEKIQEKELIIKKLINYGIPRKNIIDYRKIHHVCHAASAYYSSGFDEAVCVVMDGKGSAIKKNSIVYAEIESIFYCKNNTFKRLFKHYSTFHSLKECKKHLGNFISGINIFSDGFSVGQAFRTVSAYCGFDETDGGKTMGLSTYGNSNSKVNDLFSQKDDHYFANTTLLYPQNNEGWGKYYGEDIPKEDLAYNVQKSCENASLNMIRKAVEISGCKNVIVSGGYFMNCVSNYNIKKSLDINLFVDPLCYDGGTAVGASKLFWYKKTKETKKMKLKTLYLGPEYNVQEEWEKHSPGHNIFDPVKYEDVVRALENKLIVAMYQGRSEAGPRALGNRSLLFDPRVPDGKDIVNTIKRREAFRPFAGTVLKEYAHEWFDMAGLDESPFMMYAVDALPHTYDKIPAILHVDNTCRVQTVTEEQNYHYYHLIKAFYEKTGVPILFNTSFNLAGEPLVETVGDAFRCFDNSDIHALYFPEISKGVAK